MVTIELQKFPKLRHGQRWTLLTKFQERLDATWLGTWIFLELRLRLWVKTIFFLIYSFHLSTTLLLYHDSRSFKPNNRLIFSSPVMITRKRLRLNMLHRSKHILGFLVPRLVWGPACQWCLRLTKGTQVAIAHLTIHLLADRLHFWFVNRVFTSISINWYVLIILHVLQR